MIAGIDEAGRGPLAGPVVASAVILPETDIPSEIKDSKQLSEKKRNILVNWIKSNCIWGLGFAEPEEIDEINILQATMLAMKRAVEALSVQPVLARVDGNQAPPLSCKVECIIKGDQTVPAISAASILAKVTRDNIMLAYDETYPVYGFKQHKGYPTKTHLAALRAHGVSPIHRRSYAPVRSCLKDAHEAG